MPGIRQVTLEEYHYISRVVDEYLEENYGKDASICDMACEYNYSKRAVQRALSFHNATFSDRLANKRMEVARNLLVSTDITVRDIGKLVGYSNGGHFCKVFAINNERVTPKKYRYKHSERKCRK